MPLGEAQWNELARELQRAWARVAPEWSDLNAHDPGITVLELLAYALTDLSLRSVALDDHGRRIAGRVAGCAAARAASATVTQADAPRGTGDADGSAPIDGDAADSAMPRPLERALAEALEQQAASNLILRAILASPTDARPAFDTLLLHALRSCDADVALLAVPDGGRLVPLAWAGCTPEHAATLLHGCEAEARTSDGVVETAHDAAAARPAGPERPPGWDPGPDGMRTVLAVRMHHEGRRLGLLMLGRCEERPFSEPQRHRLEALAEHAVIALDHVRRIDAIRNAGREA
jgi:GAF domain-containing protein